MEPVIDFGDLVTGLQQLPEREKIILPALINAVRIAQNGELAKIERLVGQSIIAAARENPRGAPAELQLQIARNRARQSLAVLQMPFGNKKVANSGEAYSDQQDSLTAIALGASTTGKTPIYQL